MPDDDTCLAERRSARLHRDVAREIEDLVVKMESTTRYPRRVIDSIRHGEGYDEMVAAGGVAAGVLPMVVASWPFAHSKRDLTRLFGSDVDLDQFSAQCIIEEDGSGLVVLSDAVTGLLIHLSSLASRVSRGLNGGRFNLARLILLTLRNEQRRTSKDQQVCTAGLRYYVIQQKAFGLRGNLMPSLSEDEEEFATTLFQSAVFFVLAHETAHFALGHPTMGITTIVGEKVPVISDSLDLELEADEAALQATAAGLAKLTVSGEPPDPTVALVAAGLGASIAFLAIDLVEKALLVRRPRTHPTADVRWKALTRRFGEPLAVAETVTAFIRAAVSENTPVRSDLGQAHWRRAFRTRWLSKFARGEDSLEYTPILDVALHGDAGNLENASDIDPAMPEVLRIYENIDSAGLSATFEELGVRRSDQLDLMDPSIGLSFRSVLETLEDCPVIRALAEPEYRMLVGITFARRLVPLLPQP